MTNNSSCQSNFLWDIFCRVIDNYGDIGVCWRLAVNLAQRQQRVRLWVDQPQTLQWLAPQGHTNVEVIHWQSCNKSPQHSAGNVLIESFGCNLEDHIQQWWIADKPKQTKRWLNLEYLSAEKYVERNHLLSSPIMHGVAAGYNKTFFYPGFKIGTGGLLREQDLWQRQKDFDKTKWLHQHGISAHNDDVCSIFCYEPPALASVWQQCVDNNMLMLVTAGRSQAALDAVTTKLSKNTQYQHNLPWLSQIEFDHLLWAADFNLVRGEDSLVRALWSGKAFIWNIYKQADNAHFAKLEAFLDWLDAPIDLRIFHQVYNGLSQQKLPTIRWREWQECVLQARKNLLEQDDLSSQLIEFVRK